MLASTNGVVSIFHRLLPTSSVMSVYTQVFEAGMDAVSALSVAVGQSLNQYLKQLLVPLAKRLPDTAFRDNVTRVLQTVETNGGKEATVVIKAKIPTYNSVYG